MTGRIFLICLYLEEFYVSCGSETTDTSWRTIHKHHWNASLKYHNFLRFKELFHLNKKLLCDWNNFSINIYVPYWFITILITQSTKNMRYAWLIQQYLENISQNSLNSFIISIKNLSTSTTFSFQNTFRSKIGLYAE